MIIQGFRYFARSRSREIQVNPQNPAKFTKTRKIPRNSVEILSNSCLYSNFETSLTYWMSLLAVNPQIYVKTSSLKCANNVPKLPGVDYGAKNWAIAMMLKALPLVHFWSVYVLLLKEQMMTSVRKTLKTLVWSVQNLSISSEICPEKNPPCFYRLFSDQVRPENSHEIGRFFRDFVPKNPAKFDFFFHDLSEALIICCFQFCYFEFHTEDYLYWYSYSQHWKMAFLDDPEFIIAHIRHSCVITDDTGEYMYV